MLLFADLWGEKEKSHTIVRLPLLGAGGGGRTRMVSLPPDFESGASANSTTPAKLRYLLYNNAEEKSRFILPYNDEKFIDFLCILR